jgi:hypothetical protein
MRLGEYLTLPPDVRSDVAFLVEKIDALPEGVYKSKKSIKAKNIVGNVQFVIISELLSRTPKRDLTRLVNILFFRWRKLEKYVDLHWHISSQGLIKYFTLPLRIMVAAREYNEKVRRR